MAIQRFTCRPCAPCAPLLCADGSFLRANDSYCNATGYYVNEERAGTVDHVASAFIPICREEPQWGLGWRQLSSGFWLRRILVSVESASNLFGVVSFQNMAPTSSRQTGKVFSDHDTWPQPENIPAINQDLSIHDCDHASSVYHDTFLNCDPWPYDSSL